MTTRPKYVCHLCDVAVHSQKNMDQHLSGRKHLKRANQTQKNTINPFKWNNRIKSASSKKRSFDDTLYGSSDELSVKASPPKKKLKTQLIANTVNDSKSDSMSTKNAPSETKDNDRDKDSISRLTEWKSQTKTFSLFDILKAKGINIDEDTWDKTDEWANGPSYDTDDETIFEENDEVKVKVKQENDNNNNFNLVNKENDSLDVIVTDEIIIKKEIKPEQITNNQNVNENEMIASDDDDVAILNDNLNDANDERIMILSDDINVKYCPKCKIKVIRSDEDIENRCSVMTCRYCGDDKNFTYWCWDCSNIIDICELSFNPSTNEPGGACRQCRKLSRKRRNKCKIAIYK